MSECTNIHTVKRGTTGQPWEDHLALHGTSIDLTGCTVKGVLRGDDGTLLFQRTAEVMQTGSAQNKRLPNVRLLPEAADLDTLGTARFEWQVTYSGGRKQVFPVGSFHRIRIVDPLLEL